MLDRLRNYYDSAAHLQFEKSGDGVPSRRPVDLFCVVDDTPYFIEFKFWHTMVKARDGRLDIGKGNATDLDYRSVKKDFAKQSQIDNPRSERLIVFLAQIENYHGSSSELVLPYAKRCDSRDAVALFDSRQGEEQTIRHDGIDVTFELTREPIEMRSFEALTFRLFIYRVFPPAAGDGNVPQTI